MKPELLAPNGKPSNLNATQYKLVRTPAFKKWFGDWENDTENASKVVDENGEPLIVYHGTNAQFWKFDKSKGKGNIKQKSINFSNDKKVAKNYGTRILQCFLSLKKPLIKDYKGENYHTITFYARFDNRINDIPDNIVNNAQTEKNYDGVIFLNIQDSKSAYNEFDVPIANNYFAFNNNQIKLADGSNTTFDSKNDDIRYEYGGNAQKKDNMKKTAINWSEYYKAGGEIPENIKSKIFDKNGERRIDKKAIQTLTNYAENLPQTKDANLDRNGDYTASRKKLHQRIINSFKDELVCIQKKEPIAILMGGSPASGKSTFLRKYAPYLLKEEILKVDADEIRAMLPEYKGWNATSTHMETKDIVATLLSDRTIGIPCKYDIIYDGTMNNTKSYIPLMKLLKELGYKVFIVYMDKVPEEVVKKRALERYKKSGRFVPEAVIDDFFSRGKSALNELKSKADGYMIIDGSDGNYNVLEQEGMRLPKRRLYSQLGQPIKAVAKKK